jgi:hypothetical protein
MTDTNALALGLFVLLAVSWLACLAIDFFAERRK